MSYRLCGDAFLLRLNEQQCQPERLSDDETYRHVVYEDAPRELVDSHLLGEIMTPTAWKVLPKGGNVVRLGFFRWLERRKEEQKRREKEEQKRKAKERMEREREEQEQRKERQKKWMEEQQMDSDRRQRLMREKQRQERETQEGERLEQERGPKKSACRPASADESLLGLPYQ